MKVCEFSRVTDFYLIDSIKTQLLLPRGSASRQFRVQREAMAMVRLKPFLPKGLGRKTLTHSVHRILLYSSASSDALTGMDLAVWPQPYKSVFINCYIKYFLIPKSPTLIYMSF